MNVCSYDTNVLWTRFCTDTRVDACIWFPDPWNFLSSGKGMRGSSPARPLGKCLRTGALGAAGEWMSGKVPMEDPEIVPLLPPPYPPRSTSRLNISSHSSQLPKGQAELSEMGFPKTEDPLYNPKCSPICWQAWRRIHAVKGLGLRV